MSKTNDKRDEKGRFTKKSNMDNGIDYKSAYEQLKKRFDELKKERDTYKLTAEKVSSMHLNKCAEWGAAKTQLLDVIRIAYTQLGWFKDQMSYFKKLKHREQILDMEMELDRLFMRAEGLDKE